jgi:hypothetical protein
MSYPQQRRLDTDRSLQRRTAALLKAVTGKTITDEWAAKVIRHVLDGKNPGDPWRYIRGAILGCGDPVTEFLPISLPSHNRTVAEALAAAIPKEAP